MPRYYFHLQNDFEVPDHEGQILPDVITARRRALKAAGEIISEGLSHGRLVNLGHSITVEDEGKQEVFTLRFADLIEPGT